MDGNVLTGVLVALRDGKSYNGQNFAVGDVWGRLEVSEGFDPVTMTLKAFGAQGAADFSRLAAGDRVAFKGQIVQGRPYAKGDRIITPTEVHVHEYSHLGEAEAGQRAEYPVAQARG